MEETPRENVLARILALRYKRSRGWPWRAAAKLTEFSFSVKSFEVSVASVAPFVYSQTRKRNELFAYNADSICTICTSRYVRQEWNLGTQ